MISDIAVGDQRSDTYTATRQIGNFMKVQSIQVDQSGRVYHRILHQVDEIGSAGDELCTLTAACDLRGFANSRSAYILEVIQRAPSTVADAAITCFTAATMLG